jgi:hypothetical protein
MSLCIILYISPFFEVLNHDSFGISDPLFDGCVNHPSARRQEVRVNDFVCASFH